MKNNECIKVLTISSVSVNLLGGLVLGYNVLVFFENLL